MANNPQAVIEALGFFTENLAISDTNSSQNKLNKKIELTVNEPKSDSSKTNLIKSSSKTQLAVPPPPPQVLVH